MINRPEDRIAMLLQKVEHIEAENAALKAELKAINATLDDPRTDLTMTACEVIVVLKEQVAQLEREKEYRYVEQILRPIRILLKVAECAESLADNSEEMEGEDGRIHVGMAADFDELSDALDLLDELPDDKPGYVLGGAAKAAWALHDIIGDTND